MSSAKNINAQFAKLADAYEFKGNLCIFAPHEHIRFDLILDNMVMLFEYRFDAEIKQMKDDLAKIIKERLP